VSAHSPQHHEYADSCREQQPTRRLGQKFDSPYVAADHAVAIEWACSSALIRGGATRVVRGSTLASLADSISE